MVGRNSHRHQPSAGSYTLLPLTEREILLIEQFPEMSPPVSVPAPVGQTQMCLSLSERIFSSVFFPFALAPVLPAGLCSCAENTSESGSNMSARYQTLAARSQVGTKDWTAPSVSPLRMSHSAFSSRISCFPTYVWWMTWYGNWRPVLRCLVTRPKLGSGLLRFVS